MLKSIAYLSVPKYSLSLLDQESIYDDSKVRNNKLNIVGILFKTDTNFFEILEGESTVVDKVFEKIKKDPRHNNIVSILDIPIKIKTFNAFSTGCEISEDTNALFALQEYIVFMQNNYLEHSEVFSDIIAKLFKE